MRKPTIEDGVDPMLALRVYMISAGLTQVALANKIGMSPATMSRKLKGNREFKLSEIKAIASALNLSADETVKVFLQQI